MARRAFLRARGSPVMAEVGINELTAKISLDILLRKPKASVISFYWSD
jgi:hypothetical protein